MLRTGLVSQYYHGTILLANQIFSHYLLPNNFTHKKYVILKSTRVVLYYLYREITDCVFQ